MPNSEFIVPDFGNDAALYAALGQELEASGEVHSAATAYDRAFGLAPDDTAIRTARQTLLNSLAGMTDGLRGRMLRRLEWIAHKASPSLVMCPPCAAGSAPHRP